MKTNHAAEMDYDDSDWENDNALPHTSKTTMTGKSIPDPNKRIYDMSEDNDNTYEAEASESLLRAKAGNMVHTQLLTVIQLIICIIAIVAALIIKTIGGKFYADTATKFFDLYNASIYTGSFNPASVFTDEAEITETSLKSDDEVSK